MRAKDADPRSNQIAVSVVIPMYNRRDLIGRAVDSVLAQTYRNFELIVVDDGSTDGAGDVVRQYKDSRVRLITQPNGGECAARNRGVAEIRTDWVAFLDSDDEWLPTFLERTVAALEANRDIDLVFTNVARSNLDALDLPASLPGGVVDDYLAFFVDNFGRGITSSSVLIRRTMLESAGAFPVGIRHGGDIDCWTRLMWEGAKIWYVPEALSIYHTQAAGRVMNENPVAFCDCHKPMLASYERWKSEGRIPDRLLPSTERFAQFMLLRHARMLTDVGRFAESRRVLRTQCHPSLCGWARYLKAYVRNWIPTTLLHFLRVHRSGGR